MTETNWEISFRALQRRMATAVVAEITVRDRIDLINAIILPAVLFTANFFPPSAQIKQRLARIQKSFLWK